METPPAPSVDIPSVPKRPARLRADQIRDFRCKNLIAVIEDPQNPRNIGTVIRNVNALGVEKVYVIDPRGVLPDQWEDLRADPKLAKLSVSAVKWTFVKRFNSTEDCLAHLEHNRFVSIVTSPHVKGKASVFLHEGDYAEHAKLAVWFGNETRGISPLAIERSSLCVAIPMFGMVESLNLGTSSGIVLYEVAKQRRDYASKYRLRDRRGQRSAPLPVVIPPEAWRARFAWLVIICGFEPPLGDATGVAAFAQLPTLDALGYHDTVNALSRYLCW